MITPFKDEMLKDLTLKVEKKFLKQRLHVYEKIWWYRFNCNQKSW